MPVFGTLSADKLMRLIGGPNAPVIVDVRIPDDFAEDPRLIPTSLRRSHKDVTEWVGELPPGPVVVVCHHGLKLSHGVAAWLRHLGRSAEVLEGGFVGWAEAGLPLVPVAVLPPRDGAGRTLWVTRSRPKIDRIACPWLIRRFVDPAAVFLFVAPAEVAAVAEKFGATPFDIEDTRWSHDGDRCTFDTMVTAFGLETEPMARLATIVRGADTGRLDLAPECAGLLAASLGFSRLHGDDLTQMEASFALYDALYRWCRDATDETHSWPHKRPAGTP